MCMQHAEAYDSHPSFPTPPFQQATDRIGAFLVAHFGLIFTLIIGLLLLAAFVDPILSFLGLDAIAKPLFYSMHLICAQIPSHSFYLFGHQVCLCERCCAIYSSMFLGGLAFVLSKKRLPGIPWWGIILLSIPMAWDGLTQMIGLRESTWELRLITGALFGFALSWFMLPLMQKTLEAGARG
jgi:uncharacterized membrane protein